MDRTHETYIADTMRDVYFFGAARVRWHFFYRWFGADRITKRVWAGMVDAWDKVLEEEKATEKWQLGLINTGRTDEICLICMDPAGADESHFELVSNRLN